MSDNTMDEMIKRHDKERKEFQSACDHKEISDWMASMWAPGHMGPPVKICCRCNKTMARKKWDFIDGGEMQEVVDEDFNPDSE